MVGGVWCGGTIKDLIMQLCGCFCENIKRYYKSHRFLKLPRKPAPNSEYAADSPSIRL
ncbi:MAG: hypothetical protein C5S49_06260 [Candidatus Methanogaster sp.]|nr:MAG: hypothetical protein C5S49_06260 [ANME-2 cluster archaeon]